MLAATELDGRFEGTIRRSVAAGRSDWLLKWLEFDTAGLLGVGCRRLLLPFIFSSALESDPMINIRTIQTMTATQIGTIVVSVWVLTRDALMVE